MSNACRRQSDKRALPSVCPEPFLDAVFAISPAHAPIGTPTYRRILRLQNGRQLLLDSRHSKQKRFLSTRSSIATRNSFRRFFEQGCLMIHDQCTGLIAQIYQSAFAVSHRFIFATLNEVPGSWPRSVEAITSLTRLCR
jgi:hypothetical protein